jgi:hypothetical protein
MRSRKERAPGWIPSFPLAWLGSNLDGCFGFSATFAQTFCRLVFGVFCLFLPLFVIKAIRSEGQTRRKKLKKPKANLPWETGNGKRIGEFIKRVG